MTTATEPLTSEERQELINAHQTAAIKKAAAGKDSSYHEQRIQQLRDATPTPPLTAAKDTQTCTCGHLVSEHHPDFGTCNQYPQCDCETRSVGPDDRADAPTTGVHTATPWQVLIENGVPYIVNGDEVLVARPAGGGKVLLSFEQIQANAAFIVKAVNSHDALVAALRMFVDAETNENYGYATKADQIMRATLTARAALNAVEGGSNAE